MWYSKIKQFKYYQTMEIKETVNLIKNDQSKALALLKALPTYKRMEMLLMILDEHYNEVDLKSFFRENFEKELRCIKTANFEIKWDPTDSDCEGGVNSLYGHVKMLKYAEKLYISE